MIRPNDSSTLFVLAKMVSVELGQEVRRKNLSQFHVTLGILLSRPNIP